MKRIKPFTSEELRETCNNRHRSTLEACKILEKAKLKDAIKEHVPDPALEEILLAIVDKCLK